VKTPLRQITYINGRDSIPDVLERTPSNYTPLKTFALEKNRQYQQQYADIYFLRLTKIKPAVEEVAVAEWEGLSIGNEKARRVERVLDVRQGELCYVAGTIYVDMPLKPNVMDDVATDVSILLSRLPGEKHTDGPMCYRDGLGRRQRRKSTFLMRALAPCHLRTTLAG
jgi:hypothetical protein